MVEDIFHFRFLFGSTSVKWSELEFVNKHNRYHIIISSMRIDVRTHMENLIESQSIHRNFVLNRISCTYVILVESFSFAI